MFNVSYKKVVHRNDGHTVVTTVCPFCGKEEEVIVRTQDFLDYQSGDKLVQDAFRYISADDRECLVSSLCKACQTRIFG